MADAAPGQKLKVFISYARRDSSDFAEELVAGLELAGFAPILDRHDIAAGEDWEARLRGLIQQADTIVFVVSPEAVKSERCAWEVDKAHGETKRVLPVIFKSVPDSDIPEGLRRLQFIRFDTGPGITRPLALLADALRQNIDWIREHTRLGELAQRWDARGRPESLTLRADDLVAAQSWADKRPASAPPITDSIRNFIAASRQAEEAYFAKSSAARRHMLRMRLLVSTLAIIVAIGVIGWINEADIVENWRWYTVTRPFVVSQVRPFVLSAKDERALKQGSSFHECAKVCPDMVVVPAGSFMMGSPETEPDRDKDEGPQHKVTFARPFAVSKFEMTFDEWDTCASYGACAQASDGGWGRGQRPVIYVTWDDARRYAEWLAKITGKPYRLLAEAEYEYAARAGSQTPFPWGENVGVNNANCNGCGSQWDGKQTAPVGSFAPNQFGLYDMVGNVWEWVEDCYHSDYIDGPDNGSAWTSGRCAERVVRGGSWSAVPSRNLRSAARYQHGPDLQDRHFGFRVGRTLMP
jgi:formylglycine-generating enzyme required for sulfatase activity